MQNTDLVNGLRAYAEKLRASVHVQHTGADLVEQAADALEAATRVPVQGEPNACLDHKPVQHRDGQPPWCNTCGRAAVPDAATELERERKLGAARQRYVFETGQHNERLLSERDAALAAVERVRELHWREPGTGVGWCAHCIDDDGPWPCLTVAALDGAPELQKPQ